MLGKLMKYEFKATGRMFFPMYIAMILVALLNKFFFAMANGTDIQIIRIFSGLLMFFYVIAMIAVSFITFFVIIQRFYKNLLSSEGYLMMTLPVQPHEHILAKFIPAVVWVLTSSVVVLLSVFIMIFENINKEFWRGIERFLGNSNTHTIVLTLLIVLVTIGTSTMQYYACIAVGHLSAKRRVLSAFLAYLVFYVVEQFVMAVIIVLLTTIIAGIHDWNVSINIILYFALVYSILKGVLFFFVTNSILKKKVNLN